MTAYNVKPFLLLVRYFVSGRIVNIKHRVGLVSAAFGELDKIWRASNISNMTKIELFETLVI